MCGRFVVAGAATHVVEMFGVDLVAQQLPGPSYNIAPTDNISIVLDTIPKGAAEDGEPIRRLESARWGLIPGWAKDSTSGGSAINARIETAAEKPTFSTAVVKRRAAIPATGYYEWKTTDGAKVPHFIHAPDGGMVVFAGLYEWWRNPAAADDAPDRWVLSTTILTRDASTALAGIHDRMPVFLSPELLDDWLDPHTEGSPELLAEVSANAENIATLLEFHEVDSRVGNVRSTGASLIEPLPA